MSDRTPQLLGLSQVPLRQHEPRNTIAVGDALADLKTAFESIEGEFDPARVQLGVALQRARLRQNITQAELAERSSIPQGRISDIELGKGNKGPTIDVVDRLAKVLGLNIALVGDLGKAEIVLASSMQQVDGAELTQASYDLRIGWALLETVLGDKILDRATNEIRSVLGSQPARLIGTKRPAWGVWKCVPHTECRLVSNMPSIVAAITARGSVVRGSGHSIPESNQVVALAPGEEVRIQNDSETAFGFMVLTLDRNSAPELGFELDLGA